MSLWCSIWYYDMGMLSKLLTLCGTYSQRINNAKLHFLWCKPEQAVEQTVQLLLISDAMASYDITLMKTWEICVALYDNYISSNAVKEFKHDSEASEQDAVRCHYNTVDFLQNPHNRYPIARAWYGVCFVSVNSDLCPDSVAVVPYVLSYFIGPHYHGTWL